MVFRQRLLLPLAALAGLCAPLLGCESGNAVDDFFQVNSLTNVAIGDSALSFSPSSFDFGGVAVNSSGADKAVVVSNSASSSVFIGSTSANSTHFAIVSDDCPRSPTAFAAGQACRLVVRFTPLAAGAQSLSLSVRYGVDSGNPSAHVSSAGLSGTGVSPLTFAGLTSIGPVTHNSLTLVWPATAAASSFLVFRIVAGAMVYEKVAVNTGGGVTGTTVTSLTPGTTYAYRVRAIDQLGSSEGNTRNVTASTNANASPSLTPIADANAPQGSLLTVNASDANTAGDTDSDGDAITYSCFYDTTANGVVAATLACSSLLNEAGTPATFSTSTGVLTWTPPYALAIGAAYEFKITGTDPYSAASSDIFVETITSGTPILAHTPAGDLGFPSSHATIGAASTLDFYNTRSGTDAGVASYTCYFDRAVDGAVAATAACTTLPGTATFDTTTGILSWTPDSAAYGAYEIKATGTNAAGSGAEIVVIDVRQDLMATGLLAYLDAQFANLVSPGINSPLTSTFKNLVTAATGFDGVLTNFAGSTSSGWAGNGATAITTAGSGPYRLVLDGINDRVETASSLSAESNLMFDAWIRPTSSTTASRTLADYSDSSNRGVRIKQSALADGALELSIGSKSYVDEVMADSPAGYWRLSESGPVAVDVTASKLHGTYVNVQSQATAIASAGDRDPGVTISAVTNTGHVKITGGYTSTITGDETHTVEMWVNPAAVANQPVILSTNGTANRYFLELDPNIFYWGIGATYRTYARTFTSGTWYHIVTVKTGAGDSGELYVNGVLETSYTGALGNTPAVTDDLLIGSYSTAGYSLIGIADEVAVYTTALSQARIQAHYNARARPACRTSARLIDNLWQHVTALVSGASTLSLYVNGESQCSVPITGDSSGSATTLRLGADSAGSNHWSGAIGAARAYSSGVAADAATNFAGSSAQYDQYLPMAGLKLWLRADSLVHQTNGTAVGWWEDGSGNGNHAYQATTNSQPIYSTNGLNAKPAIVFDGSDDYFNVGTTGFPTGSAARSYFAVYKAADITSRTFLLSYGVAANGQMSDFEVNSYNGGAPDGDLAIHLYDDGFESAAAGANAVTANTASVFTGIYAGGTPATSGLTLFWANGASLASEAIGGTIGNQTINTQLGNGRIGSRYASPTYGAGALSELLYYSGALSTADRKRVERYLGAKYGITVP